MKELEIQVVEDQLRLIARAQRRPLKDRLEEYELKTYEAAEQQLIKKLVPTLTPKQKRELATHAFLHHLPYFSKSKLTPAQRRIVNNAQKMGSGKTLEKLRNAVNNHVDSTNVAIPQIMADIVMAPHPDAAYELYEKARKHNFAKPWRT
jgi:hypothetical protein